MKLKKKNVEDILVFFLIFYTSLYTLLPFSNFSSLDEIVVLLLLFLLIVFNENRFKINMSIKIMGVFLIYSLFVTILNQRSLFGFFSEFPYLIKVPVVFITISQMSIDIKRRDKFYIFFVLANIPSILIGIWQYKNRSMGWSLGLKMRNGFARVMGYAGHPIWYAFILILIIIIAWYLIDKFVESKLKSIVFKVAMAIILLTLINGTQSRYSLAVFAFITFVCVACNLPVKTNSLKLLIVLLGIFVALFFGWSIFQDIIYGSDEMSVRSIGLRSIPKAIINYPLGSGIGTFGNSSSILYNKGFIYNTLGITAPNIGSHFNSGNYYESTFAQKVVETGLIGTTIYYYFFLYPLKFYKRNKDLLDLLILLVFILNSIMNIAYQLPLIYISAIAYASLINQRTVVNSNPIFDIKRN